MSLYRRKDSPNWWIKLVSNGRVVQASAGTADRRQAQELHDRMKVQMWEQSRLGIRPRRTWREAVVRYCEDAQSNRSFVHTQTHLRWIDRQLGELYLDEITRDRIDATRTRRLEDGVSAATVNRMLEIIRTILRRAEREWEWIDRAPHIRMLKEPRLRERFLSRKEAVLLLRELPPHLRAIAMFALESGMRMREILRLRWDNVDLPGERAWVLAANAKNGRPRPVPLSEVALGILGQQQGQHPTHVFTFNGEPMDRCNQNAWRQAVKRAGLTDFRFHDLRHTWASWMAQAGIPLQVIQTLGGWRTAAMVQRYAHFQPGHLQPYAQQMSATCGLGSVIDPKLRLGYAADSSCAEGAATAR